MKRTLAQLLTDAAKKAECGREITCPHCNQTFTESYRTDPSTSSTTNADDVNEQDQQLPAYDNARRIDKLNALTESLVVATNKQK